MAPGDSASMMAGPIKRHGWPLRPHRRNSAGRARCVASRTGRPSRRAPRRLARDAAAGSGAAGRRTQHEDCRLPAPKPRAAKPAAAAPSTSVKSTAPKPRPVAAPKPTEKPAEAAEKPAAAKPPANPGTAAKTAATAKSTVAEKPVTTAKPTPARQATYGLARTVKPAAAPKPGVATAPKAPAKGSRHCQGTRRSEGAGQDCRNGQGSRCRRTEGAGQGSRCGETGCVKACRRESAGNPSRESAGNRHATRLTREAHRRGQASGLAEKAEADIKLAGCAARRTGRRPAQDQGHRPDQQTQAQRARHFPFRPDRSLDESGYRGGRGLSRIRRPHRSRRLDRSGAHAG